MTEVLENPLMKVTVEITVKSKSHSVTSAVEVGHDDVDRVDRLMAEATLTVGRMLREQDATPQELLEKK